MRTAEFVIGEVISGSSWKNLNLTPQTDVFRVKFDVTSSGTNINGVVGFSTSDAVAYTDLATIVRFNPDGQIDARNGGAYQADVTLPYAAQTEYHVEMEINIPAKTYSVSVTPEGAAPVQIANNYSFRTEQNSVSSLQNIALYTTAGTFTFANFAILDGSRALSSPENFRLTVQP